MIIYINGDFFSDSDAKISVFDHGFLYGDGVFEGIRAYNGKVFCLDAHINRFYESAKSIQLTLPLTQAEMKEAILETIRRNDLHDAYIRLIVSRGKGKLGLDPRTCEQPTIVIIVDAETRHPEDHAKITADTSVMRVVTTSFRRNGPDVLSPQIKSTNYLNNILAKLQANAAGVQDAIFLNTQGFVCELTGDNVFIVKDSRLITPPLWHGILNGVTRGVILRAANSLGFETLESPVTIHDLYTCDECFCTATRIEMKSIISVDGREIGNGGIGPLTAQIKKTFIEITTREGTPIY